MIGSRLLLFPLLLISLAGLALSQDPLVNSNVRPRPLILQPATELQKLDNEEVELRCTSWRVAVEANNLGPWKTIPEECVGYVRDYMNGKGYSSDLETVSNEAGSYARSVELSGDGKDVWIFDIDDTLLSNVPYYREHSYGLEIFDQVEFDKWVDKAMAPAIEASLKLYEEVIGLGFKVFLLTGRGEKKRSVTEENLVNAGFRVWDRLILRASEDHGKMATAYKSEKRSEMVKEGYRILGNSGDQWSDLLGSAMSFRSFKLPNPMYYIP
ncbi:Sigma1B-adaptin [Turnera subulata]|uniref:Sigma1B-adaptin n=1 Tax=Turnera subulata TaxID=218843 RepID=A0A9Q0JH12_9ROSI|nr:Sigma1B-adaptin [Turnera subulata]